MKAVKPRGLCVRLPQFCRHRSYSETKRKLRQEGHSKIILTIKSQAVNWSGVSFESGSCGPYDYKWQDGNVCLIKFFSLLLLLVVSSLLSKIEQVAS